MLNLNPFYFLLFFYLVVNFIFAIFGFFNNYVDIEFDIYNIKSSSFIFAFLLQFFVCFFIFLFFYFFNTIESKKINILSDKGAIYLFFFQALFLLYNIIFGVNTAGDSSKSSNPILNLFFILLPADLFYIIFSPYIVSSKYFKLNTTLFIVSNTLRGWMGGVLLAVFIALCRKESIKLSLRSIIGYSFFALLIFLFLPYLIQIKWVVRSNGSVFDAIRIVNEIGYLKLLDESVYYLFNRFQHNYHVALLWENHSQLNIEYEKGNILPYWGEGVLQTIFFSILGVDRPPILGNEMANKLFFSKDSWSANPGLSGWLIVLQEKFIFFIIYIFSILFIGFYTAAKYFDKKMLLVLGVFSIFYLFHGWIGMYVSMITYLLIINLIRRLKI